jgi:hypothetical protein
MAEREDQLNDALGRTAPDLDLPGQRPAIAYNRKDDH